MAGATSLSVTLNIDSVVDSLDKAAAKFEDFAKWAGESMGKVDKAASGMSEVQRRAYEVMKRSTNNHIQAMQELSKEYEVLRNKQKNGIALTQQECTQLQVLTKQFKEHQGAVGRNAVDLSKLARSFSGVGDEVMSVNGIAQASMAAIGGAVAVALPKIGEFIGALIGNIAKLGLQTQRTVAQFGAMANNMTSAAATYQAFNDVARNTNYDFDPVYNMGKQLLNMGFSAKNAAALIQQCADTAAGLGKDVSGAQQLVTTIARIQAAGKLTSRQLVELQMAGINLDDVFEPIGMSGEEAMQKLTDGTMDSQQAMDALTQYMNKFDGAMDKSKQNIIDAWGDVTGNLATACGEIGQSIVDAFSQSEIVQDLIDFTQSLVDLVRGEGCGAFSDLGAVAQFILDLIADALQFTWSVIKLGIIWINELYAAFKEMCRKVYSYLSWLLDPLVEIFTVVGKIIKKIGQEIKGGIDESFKQTFKPKVVVEDAENHFRRPVVNGSKTQKSGAGKSATNKLTEEERAVEALVKKYADASKQAQTRGKLALQTAALNASMLIGEAKAQAELENKLEGFKLNHDAVIEGYQKELALAEKIKDADTRSGIIAEINAQIDAQDKLYAAQVKAASFSKNYNELQKQSKDLVTAAFGDPSRVDQKLKDYKEKLDNFMQEVDAIEANQKDSLTSGNIGQSLSDESMSFLGKMLKMTPEELAADFEAKKEQFANFAAYIQDAMAQATAAESQNLSIGQQWADKQKEWQTELGSSMGNAVSEWLTGSKTIGQAMKDMVKDLISNAIKLLSQWTMMWGVFMAFGSSPKAAAESANKAVFGVSRFASGGFVSGPGTATSDSIPALLSNGEYVLNAAAVRRLGVARLNGLNSGKGYADGGLVTTSYIAANHDAGSAQTSEAAGARGNSINLNISAMDASSFSDFLSRGGLDAVKQALFDSNRNFASEAGVW